MRSSILAFASGAAASYGSSLPSHPGGALPGGVAAPSFSGFEGATVLPSRGGAAVCVSGIVPVAANTTKNYEIKDFTAPLNQTGLTEVFLQYVTSGSSYSTDVLGDTTTVSGTYNIGATLCMPANGTTPKGVQFLTHGVGFDRTYWDFAPGYSYVDVATLNGYATFFYDRLGTGLSAKPNGTTVVQTPLELGIAHSLVGLLRAGHFSNTTFTTVVGAGHSFGSIITQGLTSMYPSDLDAAVLTGFSTNMTALPTFITGLNLAIASQNQPYRFAVLPTEYLVSDTVISNQIGFFRAPGFDPTILGLAEATKGTVTYGELFTMSAISAPAKTFSKPVAVVNGAEDLPFCFGNCSYPTNQAAAVKMLYPSVPTSKFTTYLAPTTGHGLNLHYSAVGAYDYIQSFLKKNGLGQ